MSQINSVGSRGNLESDASHPKITSAQTTRKDGAAQKAAQKSLGKSSNAPAGKRVEAVKSPTSQRTEAVKSPTIS